MADDKTASGSAMTPDEAIAFQRLLDNLGNDHNFDCRSYKPESLARRIRGRMSQLHIDGFDVYTDYLSRNADEAGILFNTILINVTGFFRDREAWNVLQRDVMPVLVADALVSGTLRVWCAGCSTGEEVYSVAILIAEALGRRLQDVEVKLYATDIDEDALAVGRQGLYRLEQMKDLPEQYLDSYFSQEGQLYRFRRDLRRWCIFGRHNLTQDPPLARIDLLVCRNVLIYFKSNMQDRLLPRFRDALREGGYLFLGKSESLLARSPWLTVNSKWRIFRRVHQLGAEDTPPRAEPPRDVAAEIGRPAGEVGVRRLVNALVTAVVLIDALDIIREWNHAAASLFEIPVTAAIGTQFRDLDVSYRVEGLRARIEDVKSSRVASRMDDVTLVRRSGETVHLEILVAPLLEDPGRVSAIAVAAVDMTERVRLRDEVARLADQHSTATEELQSTNEELETTNEELQSTNEELETTNEELQSTNEELLATVDELQAANAELGVRTDEARRLSLYQKFVVDNVNEAVIVLDRDLRVMTWNPPAERLWAVTASQALGREFFALPIGTIAHTAREAIRRVALGVSPREGLDAPFSGADGQLHTLDLRGVLDSNGETFGVLVIARRVAHATES
jgi:two-component system, chemotaxis family, CheB/CheR fusion protein